MRFLNAELEPHTTLYKYACTKNNNYHLYIEKENKDENINNNIKENINEEQTRN